MLLPEKYVSIFDVSSEGPSSGSLVGPCLLNFPTKGLRSKRRRYFHIFQVEAYLTYCEDTRQLYLTSNSAALIPFNSYGVVLVSAECTEIHRISGVPLTSQLGGTYFRTHIPANLSHTWTLTVHFLYTWESTVYIKGANGNYRMSFMGVKRTKESKITKAREMSPQMIESIFQ